MEDLDQHIDRGYPASNGYGRYLGAVPQWTRADLLITLGLIVGAVATRFSRLGEPDLPIFDEVFVLAMARSLLQRLPFRDAHPPLSGEVVALSIKLFGDNPLSWRLPTAILGTSLVVITYLLGRRMFNSRLAGALAATFVICDGLYMVDSRLALWEIFYLTFTACGYLMLFRFAQEHDPLARRRSLACMGLALGIAMGSKLGIPVITTLFVLSSTVFLILRRSNLGDTDGSSGLINQIVGSVALVGGLSTLVYLAVFLPYYWFGWWRGIRDQFSYFQTVYQHQQSLAHVEHEYGSRWWSWPLLLRPMLYYELKNSVRAIGNPIEWWGGLTSIALMARQAIIQESFARAFVVFGYVLHFTMWIPIARLQFIHYYMPALYFAFLALGAVLADCWRGAARRWEEAALLVTLLPSLVFGFGLAIGLIVSAVIAVVYIGLLNRDSRSCGRLVCALYVAGAVILLLYFLPLYLFLPLTPDQFRARMWLKGPGLPNWI